MPVGCGYSMSSMHLRISRSRVVSLSRIPSFVSLSNETSAARSFCQLEGCQTGERGSCGGELTPRGARTFSCRYTTTHHAWQTRCRAVWHRPPTPI